MGFKQCVLLAISTLFLVIETYSDDPHNMGFSSNSKDKVTSLSKPKLPIKKNENHTIVADAVFFKRFIDGLLVKFKMTDSESTFRKAKTLVTWNSNTVEAFKAYSKMDKNVTDVDRMTKLHNLETALDEMFKDVTLVDEDFILPHFHRPTHEILDPIMNNIFIVLPMVVCVVIGMALWKGIPFWKIFFFIFIISCGWEWSHMYKKALAKREEVFHDSVKNNCRAKNFLSSLWSSGYNSECTRYHEAMTVEPFLEVNPSLAFAETFSKIVLHPLEPLGQKLGSFFHNVLQQNSYFASFFVLPLSLFILIMLLLVTSGYSFTLPFFLGKIESCRSKTKQKEEIVDNRQILELLHELKELKMIVNHIEKSSVQPQIQHVKEDLSTEVNQLSDENTKTNDDDTSDGFETIVENISSVPSADVAKESDELLTK